MTVVKARSLCFRRRCRGGRARQLQRRLASMLATTDEIGEKASDGRPSVTVQCFKVILLPPQRQTGRGGMSAELGSSAAPLLLPFSRS